MSNRNPSFLYRADDGRVFGLVSGERRNDWIKVLAEVGDGKGEGFRSTDNLDVLNAAIAVPRNLVTDEGVTVVLAAWRPQVNPGELVKVEFEGYLETGTTQFSPDALQRTDLILYGDIYEVPLTILGDRYDPTKGYDEEQETRLALAATLLKHYP